MCWPLPSANAVAKGLSITLAAQGTYSDGSVSDLGSSVVWSVSDSSIASIGVNDRGGAQLTGPGRPSDPHAQLGDKGTDVQIQVTAGRADERVPEQSHPASTRGQHAAADGERRVL